MEADAYGKYKDGYVIQLAVKMGFPIAIIVTGEKTEAIRVQFEGLGINDIYLGSSFQNKNFDDVSQKHNLNTFHKMFCIWVMIF